jgi:hypothetical protein
VEERAMLTGYRACAIREASRLASNLFGDCVAPALDRWTATLPQQPIDLWIDRYGKDVFFSKFPGSKLYLLLQADGSDAHLLNTRRLKKLFPVRRPLPIISRSSEKKPSKVWWREVSTELRYCCFRLRFHITAGLDYLLEIPHWKRAVADFRE